jgi:hypothetical protein
VQVRTILGDVELKLYLAYHVQTFAVSMELATQLLVNALVTTTMEELIALQEDNSIALL